MINRRTLLANTGAAGILSASGMGALLGNMTAQAADSSGYKALVCVFLNGGLDSYDTILPYDVASHNTHFTIRERLFTGYGDDDPSNSRARDNLLPLSIANAADYGSREFAMTADMAPLRSLFNSGNAAIVGNVGPLLEPITLAQHQSNPGLSPSRLFSHNDQQSTWMALSPEGARFGWGGAFADAHLLGSSSLERTFSAIGVSGNAVFLSGERARPYKVTPGGARELRVTDASRSVRPGLSLPASVRDQMQDHFTGAGATSSSLFLRDLTSIHEASMEANDLFSDAMESSSPLATAFPSTSLGDQLETVAETIAIRNQLGVRRQVFFVSLGGFDTHSSQAFSLPRLQVELADAIAAFYQSTVELGVSSEVTLFTASDFGRTLSVNNSGTDHGWGGHHFVVGGAVQGGRIYGDMPLHELGHDLDVGRGRLLPTTSVEQYAATLGKWFGLSGSELNAALPNLGNFGASDLGFF